MSNDYYIQQVLEAYTNNDEEFEDDSWVVVKSGEWSDEGKYSYFTEIVHNKTSDTYYSVNCSRSGSYFTDYDYSDYEVFEVVPRQIQVTDYVPINK